MIELIPAIDIIDGKCVRLTKGDYATTKVYNEDPLEVALEVESYGLQRLHVVDLDGAKSKHVVNYRTLHRIASRTSLKIDFGGGIKSDEDMIIAFENGAQIFGGNRKRACNAPLCDRKMKVGLNVFFCILRIQHLARQIQVGLASVALVDLTKQLQKF